MHPPQLAAAATNQQHAQVIFSALIDRIPPRSATANKVLVLAHRCELLSQARAQIKAAAPHLRVAVESGNERADVTDSDVIVASVQTLGRAGSGASRLLRFPSALFKCVIVDEAHHAAALTYRRILDHFGLGAKGDGTASILLCGFSATLSRQDEAALGDHFDRIVFHRPISALMAEGYLARVEARQVDTQHTLKEVRVVAGDYALADLSLAIDTPRRNALVAAVWKEVALGAEHRRRATLVFALSVAHASRLCAAFEEASPTTTCRVISHETAPEDRRAMLAEFAAGTLNVLLNCAVLVEGTDLPIVDCVVMTRPTCNANLYTQMVGRGLRRHPAKEYCLVLDFVDGAKHAVRSLVTFPSLLAACTDRRSGAAPSLLGAKATRKAARSEIDSDGVAVRITDVSQATKEAPSAPGFGLAWILLDATHWAVSSRTESIIVAFQEGDPTRCRVLKVLPDDGDEARRHPAWRRMYTMTPYPGLDEEEWGEVHVLIPRLVALLASSGRLSQLQHDAPWRARRPPSPAQLGIVTRHIEALAKRCKRRGAPIPAEDGLPSDGLDDEGGLVQGQHTRPHTWTVGRASDVITKCILRSRLLRRPVESIEDLLRGLSLR